MNDWFDEGRAGSAVDVPLLFDATVQDALWAVVAAGALVSIGLTSDGGACGVTVTFDGRWKREYFRDSEPLSVWLLGAATWLTNGGQPATSGNGGSRRRQATRERQRAR